MITDHTIVGIDAAGQLCSCGAYVPDLLEHLGSAALALWPATATRLRHAHPRRATEELEARRAEYVSDVIDRLIGHGRTDAEISDRLGIRRALVRSRRRAWERFNEEAVAA